MSAADVAGWLLLRVARRPAAAAVLRRTVGAVILSHCSKKCIKDPVNNAIGAVASAALYRL